MAGNFLTEVDGFTPVIDVVAAEVGLIPAAVYGVVWRYCQMGKGVCYASQTTMAEKLGIGQATMQRHLRALCDAGFLEDTTPTLRNKPHTYRDTGRVQITGMVQARYAERIVESAPQPEAQPTTDSDYPERIATIQSESSLSRESYEETIKRLPIDKEEISTPDAIASDTPVLKRERSLEQREHDAAQTAVRMHFQQRTGLIQPVGDSRKGIAAQWWNPIREICALVEWDTGAATRLIDATLARLDGLTVSDPHSLLKTARALVAERSRKPARVADAHGMVRMPSAGRRES